MNSRALGLSIAGLSLLAGLLWVLSGLGRFGAAGKTGSAGARRISVEQGASPAAPAALLDLEAQRAQGIAAASAGAGAAQGRVQLLSDEAPALRLTGLVLAAENGQPLEGVSVRLVAGELSSQGQTRSDGSFALAWSGPGPVDLELDHPDFNPLRCAAFDSNRTAPFLLERRGGLTGQVRWGGAGGAAGLLVEAWPQTRGDELGEPLASTRTDELGNFALARLETGEYALSARADDDQRGPTPLAIQAGLRVLSGEQRFVLLELDPGAVLEVQVLRQGAGLLQGVFVSATSLGSGLDKRELLRRTGLSDGSGRVRLTGFPEGLVLLEVIGPLGEVERLEFGMERKGHFERIELPASAAISGRVLDAAGQPVSAAWVGLARRERGAELTLDRLLSAIRAPERPVDQPPVQAMQSGPDGAFSFASVPAEAELWLVAHPPEASGAAGSRFPGTLQVPALASGTTKTGLNIALFGSRSVAGRVSLATGGPAFGAQVRAEYEQNGATQASEPVFVDSEGRYSLPAVRDRYARVYADLDGFRRALQSLSNGPQPLSEVNLVLVPKTPLFGRIVDGAGAAVEGARLSLRRGRERRNEAATTDLFGRFEFDDGPTGAWELRVQAAGYQDLNQPVELPCGEALLLTLLEQPEPPKGRLFGECLAGWSSDPVVGFSLNGMGAATLELRGGRFFATGVRSGRLRLVASAFGCERLVLPERELPPGGSLDLGTLRLFPTATLELRLEGGFSADELRLRLEPLSEAEGGVGLERPPIVLDGQLRFQTARAAWRLVIKGHGVKTHTERIVLEQEFTRHTVELQPAD